MGCQASKLYQATYRVISIVCALLSFDAFSDPTLPKTFLQYQITTAKGDKVSEDLMGLFSTLNKIQEINKTTENNPVNRLSAQYNSSATRGSKAERIARHLKELITEHVHQDFIKAHFINVHLHGKNIIAVDLDGDELITFEVKGEAHAETSSAKQRISSRLMPSGKAAYISSEQARSMVNHSINFSNIHEATHALIIGNKVILHNSEDPSFIINQFAPKNRMLEERIQQVVKNTLITPEDIYLAHSNLLLSLEMPGSKSIDRGIYSQNAGTQGGLLHAESCNGDGVACVVTPMRNAEGPLVISSPIVTRAKYTIHPSSQESIMLRLHSWISHLPLLL